MDSKNQVFHYPLAVVSACLLVGGLLLSCSASNPTEADAIRLLEEWNKETFDNLYRVKSLSKIDGQAAEVFGVKQYALSYEADLECLRLKPIDIISGPSPIVCSEVGEVHKVTGTLRFEKTEKGWQSRPFYLYGDNRPIREVQK